MFTTQIHCGDQVQVLLHNDYNAAMDHARASWNDHRTVEAIITDDENSICFHAVQKNGVIRRVD